MNDAKDSYKVYWREALLDVSHEAAVRGCKTHMPSVAVPSNGGLSLRETITDSQAVDQHQPMRMHIKTGDPVLVGVGSALLEVPGCVPGGGKKELRAPLLSSAVSCFSCVVLVIACPRLF